MKTTTSVILVLLLVGGLFLFTSSKRPPNQVSSEDTVPLPPESEDTQQTEQTREPSPILPLSNPQVTMAIRTQSAAIYANEEERESLYSINNVREGIFAGLNYPVGIRRALATELPTGNPNLLPVIPKEVDREYSDRLQLITELTSMEAMDRTREWPSVKRTWKTAADMGIMAGFSFWPPDLESLLLEGVFFNAGPADKNRSEEYDSWSRDVKVLASNLIEANRKAADAIREKAIAQLRGRGWRLEGYDF
jgi:hypothetical protein